MRFFLRKKSDEQELFKAIQVNKIKKVRSILKNANKNNNININNDNNNEINDNKNINTNINEMTTSRPTNIIIQPSFPVMTNHYHDETTTTTDTSFMNNVREHYPYNRKLHDSNHKRNFRSIFLKNPFSSNFVSASASSWTPSSSSYSNRSNNNAKNKKRNNHNSNLIKSSSSTTLDLNSTELDFSTQIIVRNDSEINNNNNNNNNIKTSEILWNKENNVENKTKFRNSENYILANNDNNNNNNSINSNNSDNNEDRNSDHKNRNRVAKMLIKGWIHVVDGMSLLNPYHMNYDNNRGTNNNNNNDNNNNDNNNNNNNNNDNNNNDNNNNNNNNNNNKDQNDKAVVPYDPDRFQLPTRHFWNSYY